MEQLLEFFSLILYKLPPFTNYDSSLFIAVNNELVRDTYTTHNPFIYYCCGRRIHCQFKCMQKTQTQSLFLADRFVESFSTHICSPFFLNVEGFPIPYIQGSTHSSSFESKQRSCSFPGSFVSYCLGKVLHAPHRHTLTKATPFWLNLVVDVWYIFDGFSQ